jgi:hypothetical protein
MSNNESFIDEVSDAVRRDKLFATFRRYGWIGALVIAAIVGGTAWQSYSHAKARTAAEAKGDAILTAMENNDAAARVEALKSVESSPVTQLLLAAEQGQSGDAEAAAATLDALANDPAADMLYRQIATFKAVLVRSATQSPADREAALQPMTAPGHPMRLLATEQIALAQIDAGDVPAALTTLQGINQDAEVTRGLQDRVQSLIVALGGTVEAAPAAAPDAAPTE